MTFDLACFHVPNILYLVELIKVSLKLLGQLILVFIDNLPREQTFQDLLDAKGIFSCKTQNAFYRIFSP